MFDNPALQWVIIFFIFVTLMCDSGIIFKDKTTISHVLKASDLNC